MIIIIWYDNIFTINVERHVLLSDKKTVQFNEEVEVKTVEAFPQVVEIDEVSQTLL